MGLVKTQSFNILIKSIALALILFGIFAVFGGGNLVIATFIFLGTLYANINFLMIASATKFALTKIPKKATSYMIVNYFIRFLLTAELIYFVMKYATYSNNFSIILAFTLPLFFPKIIFILGAMKGG